MIQPQTVLKVVDNSGAKTVKCIKIPNGFKRKTAKLGDIITVSVQKLRNKSKRTSKVKKKEICKALIIRTKSTSGKTTGLSIKFNDNAVVLINKQNNPIGTRIIGPVTKLLHKKALQKFISMATGLIWYLKQMHFLDYFYTKTLKFDLINKFYYTNLKKLPKLKKIILNFGCKTTELKTLATHLLALELITNQKGFLTTSKRSNLLLKIRKGNPTGCALTLKKASMLNFFFKSLNEIFSKIKNFNGITVHKKIEKTTFSFVIKDTLNFTELTENYSLFNNLSKLSLSFVTTIEIQEEMLFLLKSLQVPLKSSNKSRYNSIGRVWSCQD